MSISAKDHLNGMGTALQHLFDSQGIPINLNTNEGLNTLIRFRPGGTAQFSFSDKYDMMDLNTDVKEKESALDRLGRDLLNPQGNGSQDIYVIKPGESIPRRIRYDESIHSFFLSEPLDEIKKPEEPSFITQLLNSLFGIGQDVMDAYQDELAKYEAAQAVLNDESFQGAVQERMTAKNRMYTNEAKRMEFRESVGKSMEEHMDVRDKMLNETPKIVEQIGKRLDKAFNEPEKLIMGDRMEYVLIEGKTLHSLLIEEFEHKDPAPSKNEERYKKEFNEFCKDKLPQRINEMVTAACAQGKRVEVYTIDPKTGRCTDEPELWTSKDFGLSQKELQHLKEITDPMMPQLPQEDQTHRYARLKESREAVIRKNRLKSVQSSNTTGRLAKNILFGKWEAEHGMPVEKIGSAFSTQRSALQGMVYSYLLTETKMSPQDIFDPTKELDKKAEIGSMICDKVASKDPKDKEWIAKYILQGRLKIGEVVSEHMKNVDFSNSDQLFAEENRWALAAASECFDLDQEATHVKQELVKVSNEIYGPEEGPKKLQQASDYGAGFCSMISRTIDSEQTCLDGILGHKDLLVNESANMLAGKITQNHIEERHKEAPEGLLYKNASAKDGEWMYIAGMMFTMGNTLSGNLAAHGQNNIDYRVSLCRFVRDGGVKKNFNVTIDPGEGVMEMTAKTGAEKVANEKSVLQEAVSKNNAGAMLS